MAARIVVALAAVLAWPPHPMHTSVTRVSYDAAAHTLEVSMRLFTDDFASAVAHQAGARPVAASATSDAAALTYARAALSIRSGTAGPVTFTGCGQRRELDFTWVCLRAPLADEPAQLDVSNRALHELYEDQVNIVQVVLHGRTKTLMFTRADGAQRGP